MGLEDSKAVENVELLVDSTAIEKNSANIFSISEKTILVHHPSCEHHEVPRHVECPLRTSAIILSLEEKCKGLTKFSAPEASEHQISLFHGQEHISKIFELCDAAETSNKNVSIDNDTTMTPTSKNAILRAAGSVCLAVDKVMANEAVNGFCCVRPPGHHATPSESMGFCFFNNVGIGALWAHEQYGLERVAVVDIDVHHGNGTQEKFQKLPFAFFASTHIGYGFYPGSGHAWERGAYNNVVNVPLKEKVGSAEFKQAYTDIILPALENFKPNIIFISAGFDAHEDDPLGDLILKTEDFGWVTTEICAVASRVCKGRVISVLEGGYNIEAISDCAVAHVQALSESAKQVSGTVTISDDAVKEGEEKVPEIEEGLDALTEKLLHLDI